MERIVDEIKWQKSLEDVGDAKFINMEKMNARVNPTISVNQTLIKSQLTEDLNEKKYFPVSNIDTLAKLEPNQY